MKICIAGDSWGCGEWGFDASGNYLVLHRGIEEYLTQDGHRVLNLSIPGGSNMDAYNALSNFDLFEFDLIFYFQTDPLRDCWVNASVLKNESSIIDANENAMRDHYERLYSFIKRIHLLGGACKIDHDSVRSYDNLSIFIPSIIEFLCPHLNHPTIWASNWIETINEKNCSKESLDFIFEQKALQDKLYDHGKDELVDLYFHPDGRHPNRKGHQMIYERIKEELLS